jgi:septal ring factor EnvC (AmiA/AmiB activator)
MSDNQLVSVAEAARLVKRNRQTLYRDYLATGKLSSVTDPITGNKAINIAELMRVFGELKMEKATGDGRQELQQEIAQLQAKLSQVEAEKHDLQSRLSDKDAHIDDLRRVVRLLEHKTNEMSPVNAEPKARKWWPW